MNLGEGLETWDARQVKNKEKEKHHNGNGAGMPIAIQVQTIQGWCSPTVTDASRGILPPRPQDTGIPLTQQVSGLTHESSPPATVKIAGFRLNPHFSLWLMGYPTNWHHAGVASLRSSREAAMQSSPKSPRSSSKPVKKPATT
jgi:hypothetical protein